MIKVRKKKEPDAGIQQLTFRLHIHEKVILKKLLNDDKMTFQTFIEFCTKAYMKADPNMMKLLADQIALKSVPKEVMDRYTLSQRERHNIFDQIEKKIDKQQLPTK